MVDDGRGYDTTLKSASAGLQNMTDRIGALGGQLTIESAPGSGTTISGSVLLLDVEPGDLPNAGEGSRKASGSHGAAEATGGSVHADGRQAQRGSR